MQAALAFEPVWRIITRERRLAVSIKVGQESVQVLYVNIFPTLLTSRPTSNKLQQAVPRRCVTFSSPQILMTSTSHHTSVMRTSLYWRERTSDLSSLVQRDTILSRLSETRKKLNLGDPGGTGCNSRQKSSATHRSWCWSWEFARNIAERRIPQSPKWGSFGPPCRLESPLCIG